MLGKKILSTKSTPEIILNPEGIIIIRGRSMNGNLTELIGEIEEWIDKYVVNPAEVTYVDFYLEYFNKTNSKVIISMLRKMESLKNLNKKLVVNWYYEEGDEDILEKGEFLSDELNIPFNFIEIFDALLPEYFSHRMGISA
jgi:hypothetical protein